MSAGEGAFRISVWTKTPLSAKSLRKPQFKCKTSRQTQLWSVKGKIAWEEGSEGILLVLMLSTQRKAQEGSAVLNISELTVCRKKVKLPETESGMVFVRGWEVGDMGKIGKRTQTFCRMDALGHTVLGKIGKDNGREELGTK